MEGGVLPAVIGAMLRRAFRQAPASGSGTVENALNLAMTGEIILGDVPNAVGFELM